MTFSFRLPRLSCPQMLLSGIAMVTVTGSALLFLSLQFNHLEAELARRVLILAVVLAKGF